jgi:hypothetical protein
MSYGVTTSLLLLLVHTDRIRAVDRLRYGGGLKRSVRHQL